MAVYPNAIKTWTDVQDNVDEIRAKHMNDAYAEIIAIQMELNAEKAKISSAQTNISNAATAILEKTSFGVISGLTISSVDVGDVWGVECSAGVVYTPNGVRHSISAKGIPDLPVNPPDATYDRIDIIYISSLGVVTYLAGTPAATPTRPATPAGGVFVASILIQTADTFPKSANITNNPKPLGRTEWIAPTLINNATSVAGFPARYAKLDNGLIIMRGHLATMTSGNWAFILPSGFRPVFNTYIPCATGASAAMLRCYLSSGGGVLLSGAFTDYISLDSISFSTI